VEEGGGGGISSLIPRCTMGAESAVRLRGLPLWARGATSALMTCLIHWSARNRLQQARCMRGRPGGLGRRTRRGQPVQSSRGNQSQTAYYGETGRGEVKLPPTIGTTHESDPVDGLATSAAVRREASSARAPELKLDLPSAISMPTPPLTMGTR